MNHMDIVITLTLGLSVALCFGYITQKLKMSPVVGYIFAGLLVGPFTQGLKVHPETASAFAEIGVIFLMFTVGLHFHLKDLIAVKNVAIPAALVQIAGVTIFTMLIAHSFGWSWVAGGVLGVALSVASTVLVTRILTDNKELHTPIGHVSMGWLIFEDLFTIFVLVLLPVICAQQSVEISFEKVLAITFLKISLLVVFTLVAGQKLIPLFLKHVALTRKRDLFTLSIYAIALGIAVGASYLFGVSMALGAFLAGMIVGQSDFGTRATAEALPMKDVFAVLFFVSVGMLLNPDAIFREWKLVLFILGIILFLKPIFATAAVWILGKPFKTAFSIGLLRSQIGEFSFMLASVALSLGVITNGTYSAIIAGAIISIIVNPILYDLRLPIINLIKKYSKNNKTHTTDIITDSETEKECVIIIGYGPVGQAVSEILINKGRCVVVIELNINTVNNIQKSGKDILAVHGDALQQEVLEYAGINHAKALIISTPMAPAADILKQARSLNKNIKIFVNTSFLCNVVILKKLGADVVVSSEGCAAIKMSELLLEDYDTIEQLIDDNNLET